MRLVWTLVLACSCGHAVAGEFIPEGARFAKDSTLGEPGTSTNPMLGSAYEKGEIDGRDFYIYASGRAMYGQWQIYCSTDKMSDARSCTVTQEDLWISVEKGGVASVIVGDKHHPGTPVQLRLDKAAPITSKAFGWSGKAAAKIVSDASKSENIFTRYTRWPNDVPTTREISAEGLATSVRIAQWMVAPKPPR